MRTVDWLTYTGIEHLKKLNQFYGCEMENQHSKHELICSLLRQMGQKKTIKKMMEQLSPAEHRFLQLLVLDHSPAFSMEELLVKARAAQKNEEEQPRTYVVNAIKKGWLFPGYSLQTQNLYHVPSDLREQIIALLREPYKKFQAPQPSVFRDEGFQMVYDLHHFLDFLSREIVRLTNDGAIYKQQQRQLFQNFFIQEKPLQSKGPRFGFGRRYHLYPDRFSLIYDYGFYQEYFIEQDGYICLSESGFGKINKTIDEIEAKNLYRFWIRLYRKPINHLPIIIRWIGLLAHPGWFPLDELYNVVKSWLSPFYYETEESLYRKVLQMLCHLGVIRLGSEAGRSFVSLTKTGVKWMLGVSVFREQAIEDEFIQLSTERKNRF